MVRLIDADALFDSLEALKANLIHHDRNYGAHEGLNMAQLSVQIAPTVEALIPPVKPWDKRSTYQCGILGNGTLLRFWKRIAR